MANEPLGAVLQHIRSMIDAQIDAEATDGQLLTTFVARDDEAAFASLLKRHGPMVLSIGRRVLGQEQDAEDVFQATFLLLARKAATIRKQASVGSWLHGVALRLAVRAKLQKARRKFHEKQISEMSKAKPNLRAAWQELHEALDETLHQLPEKYRSVLLQCYLEGRTQEEAAQQLGCPLGTVRSRLAKARKMLRDRLTRRGLAFSGAALAALLATNTASAISARLLKSTLRAALQFAKGHATAGLISAGAAALVERGLKTMLATKIKIATVLLLAVSVIGVGLGTLARQALAQPHSPSPSLSPAHPLVVRPEEKEKEKEKEKETTTPEESKKVAVTGHVLDAGGKPVRDAKVAVVSRPRRRLQSWEWTTFGFDALDRGQTNDEGRFHLNMPPPTWRVLEPVTPPWPRDETALVVGALGHGIAWRSLEGQFNPSEVSISLPREEIIHGRLIDLQGQPAAGVQLVVARVESKTPGRDGEGIDFRVPPKDLPPWPKPVTTDSQGRFVLRGIGRGQVATLEVHDDRFACQQLVVQNRDKQPPGEVSFSLAPPHRIIGRVVRADTRQPVAGARLSVWAQRHDQHLPLGAIDGRTDSQGRFQLNPFAGDSFYLIAFAPEGEPYLNPIKTLEWPKGAIQQEIEIALPPGVLVRGSITEAASGKPVAGATVEFWPYRPNNRPLVQSGVTVWITSGPDGSFRMAVPPGPGHLLVNGPVPDYIPQPVGANDLHYGKPGGAPSYWHAVLPLALKPEDKTKDLRVTLRRGVTVKGYLVGPDDKPVSHAQMLCGSRPAPLERSTRPLPIWDGHFELRGCDPDLTYPVLFLTAPYKPGINGIGVGRRSGQMKLHLAPFFGGADWLGAAVQISAKQAGDKPIRVRLAPCGSVVLRLVNGREQLQPLVKFSPPLDLVVTPGPDLDQAWDQGVMGGEIVTLSNESFRWTPVNGVRTDAQGRLTLTGLIPGATYRINNLDGTTAKDFTVPSPQAGEPVEITVKIR